MSEYMNGWMADENTHFTPYNCVIPILQSGADLEKF